MSTTIDNRVVEMEFDNRQFESNVKTSMTTIEKLKQSLDFKGTSKGFENIQAASSKCDLSSLSKSAENVQRSFSAMQVVGVTALATLTNQAVNAGQRMVKSLTIGSAIDGYREYETQMNSIQTILANTQKEGATIEIVNKHLDELNEYADKTIYNFSEMTRNIGTFTAAGVKLDTSVSSIKGIANLAATSGSSSQQASTAMYQLSQAIASGTVKLMDWNSVVNAGMGGQVFQDALIRTSEHLQTGAKAAIDTQGSFRESLTLGWLTTDVLTQTLDQFATAADTQEEYEAAIKKFVSQGYTLEEAKQIADMARTAGNAATKVKTFTQLIDTLKEAMGSGWAQTWRILIGDFEQARSLWTSVSDVLSGFINKFSEARNSLLESALGKSFGGLAKKVSSVMDPVMDMADNISEVTDVVADLGAVVDDVILGKFGTGQERFDALTQAGKNYYRVQNEVNKKLNNSFRYTDEQIAAQDKLLGVQSNVSDATKATAKNTDKLSDAQKKQLKQLAKLSQEELENKGCTEEQIKALTELKSIADDLGMPFDEFIDKLEEINGRWILIDSFKNIGRSLMEVFGAIGTAFSSVFDAIKPDQIFDLIVGFHGFTAALIPSEETLDKITRAFRGLFSAIQLVSTVVGGVFKIAFAVVSELLESAGLSVLDLVAILGDMVTKFNDWFQDSVFSKFVEAIAEGIKTIIDGIQEFIRSLQLDDAMANAFKSVCDGVTAIYNIVKMSLPKIAWPTIINNVLKLFGTTAGQVLVKVSELLVKYRDWLKENTLLVGGLNTIAEIIKTVIEGVAELVAKFVELEPVKKFVEGISDAFGSLLDNLGGVKMGAGIFDTLLNALQTAFTSIGEWMDTLANSKDFGADLIAGLTQGILSGIGTVVSAVGNLATSIIETICSVLGIHSPSIVMFGIGKNTILGLVKGIIAGLSIFGLGSLISGIASSLSGGFSGLTSNLFDAGRTLFTSFWEGISSVWSSILSFASGVGQGIADVLGGINWGVIFTVAGAAAGFFMLNKFADALGVIGKAMAVVKKPVEEFTNILKTLDEGLKNYFKAKALALKAAAIKDIAISIAILAASVWLLSKVDTGGAVKGVLVIAALSGILVGLVWALSTFADPKLLTSLTNLVNLGKIALLVVSLAASFILLAVAARLISSLDWGAIAKAGVALIGLTAVVAALMFMTKFTGNARRIDAVASMLIKASAAMVIMAIAIRLIASLSGSDVGRAVAGIAGLSAIVVGLIAATALLGKGPMAAGVSTALLAVAGTIGILAIVMKLISSMTWPDLGKALVGMTALGGIMVGLMAATKLINADMGATKASIALVAVAIAMGILANVAKTLAKMSWDEFGRAAGGVVALGLLITALIAVTRISGGEKLGGVAITLLTMSIAIGILAGVCVLLGLIDAGALAQGIYAVSMLAVLVGLLTYVSKYGQNLEKSMMWMAVSIGILAGALALLSFIDPSKLVAPTLALSALMGMFALITYSTKFLTESFKSLIVMAVVVGLLAGTLALLSNFDSDSVLASAISLSLLMGVLSGCFVAISKTSAIAVKAMIPLVAMVGVVALLAVILGLMAHLNVEASLETAAAISLLLLAMSGSLLMMSFVGLAVGPALTGLGILAAFIVGLTALLVTIGAFFHEVSAAQTYINAGIGVLKSIFFGLGEAFGGLVEGFTNSLPAVGTNLSSFMTNLQPFLDIASAIDPAILKGIASLAGAILMLTAADLLSSISAFISGPFSSGGMSGIVEDLVPFGEALGEFADAVAGVDVSAIERSADAAKALAKMAKNIPNSGGLLGAIAGNNDLGDFAVGVALFGQALAEYGNSVRGLDVDAILTSAKGAEALAEVANVIPNIGGLRGGFAGNKDLSVFGSQLKQFGLGMADYSAAVENINVDAVKESSKAATALAEVAEIIPNTGGMAAAFAGDNTLDVFGSQLKAFGQGMADYSAAVENVKAGPIKASAKAASALAELAEAIPKTGGFAQAFTGSNSLTAFAGELESFGAAMVGYSNTVAGVEWGPVTSSAKAAKAICNLVSILSELKGNPAQKLETFNSFGEGLPEFGRNIKEFANVFQGLEVDQFNQTVKMAQSIEKMVDAVVGCVTKLTEDGAADKFEKFTDAGKYTTAIGELKTLRDSLIQFANFTVETDASDLSTNAKDIATIATSAASIIESLTTNEAKFSGFTDAGKYTTAIDALKTVRESLVEFGDLSASPVDANTLSSNATGIKDLVTSAATTIDTLTLGGAADKFANFTDGSKYTTAIGTLKTIRDALVDFSNMADSTVDAATLGTTSENILTAAQKAITMIDALTQNGVDAKFTSFDDAEKYTEPIARLKTVRDAIVDFASFSGEDLIDVSGIASDTEAINTLFTNATNMITSMEENGEIFGGFATSKVDFSGAIEKLKTLKTDLVSFATISGEDGGFDPTSVSTNTESLDTILTSVKTMMTTLTDSADVFTTFGASEVDFTGAITNLQSVRDAMTAFGNFGGEDGAAVDGSALSTNAEGLSTMLSTIKTMMVSLNNSASVFTSFMGSDVDFVGAINELKEIAEPLTSLATSMGSAKGSDFSSYSTAIYNVAQAINATSDVDTSGVSGFVDAVNTLATADVASVISTFSGAKDQISNIGSDVANAFINAFVTTGTSSAASASSVLSALAVALSDTTEISTAGTAAADAFATGIDGGVESANTAGFNLADCAASGASDNADAMSGAGNDLVSGLVNAITSPASMKAAYRAGYELGQEAVRGEKKGQESKSPSKATYRAGIWFGEGLVNGIGAMAGAVYTAGHDLGDTAVSSLSFAMDRTIGMINSMDAEAQPTIRPVIDLSNVESGVGTISDMLNMNPSIGMTASLNSIGTNVNERQNGERNALLSAIGDLRTAVSGNAGNTYIIDGITYDDGSNIVSAVETLVSAARIERRV